MDVQTVLVAIGLLVVGFVLGRLSARGEGRTVTTVVQAPPTPNASADALIEADLRAGRKIEAVKRYRETYRTGLKEAKDACDALEARLGR